MPTTFPQAMIDTGLVLAGHLTRSVARAQTAAWLETAHGLSEADAEDTVDGIRVTSGCWWSDDIVPDSDPPHIAAFVADPAPWPSAVPVTVVALKPPYITVSSATGD